MAARTTLIRMIAWRGLAVAGLVLLAWVPVTAQTTSCVLIPDDQNPPERILRCGPSLEIRQAAGTLYRLQPTPGAPETMRLESGAAMIQFRGGEGRRGFQVLAPQAVASVRGTKWVVDTSGTQTSTFVIEGIVSVARQNGGQSAELGPGEGADVDGAAGPVVVKRWPAARVRALLSRFGQ